MHTVEEEDPNNTRNIKHEIEDVFIINYVCVIIIVCELRNETKNTNKTISFLILCTPIGMSHFYKFKDL